MLLLRQGGDDGEGKTEDSDPVGVPGSSFFEAIEMTTAGGDKGTSLESLSSFACVPLIVQFGFLLSGYIFFSLSLRP